MPIDSRQRILEHLKRSGEASVAELSRALGLTPVTIRHHLEALRGERLISEPNARRKRGPGRPEMVYRLKPRADEHMPRNYGELCDCLLNSFTGSSKAESVTRRLSRMGRELGAGAQLPGEPGSRKRSRAALGFLEQRGYFPAIMRDGAATQLILANCPYLEAARDHPDLCLFDQALLGDLFGQAVRIGGRIVDRDPVCTFLFLGGSLTSSTS